MSALTPPPRLVYSADCTAALRKAFGELCDKPIFTTWRWVQRDGKWSKAPTHPAGTAGVTIDTATNAFVKNRALAGLGVKLGAIPGTDDVLFGIDYDGAAKGPLPDAWPTPETYIERSPSGGDKFHVLGLYKGKPLEGKRKDAVEIYTEGRFFTLTGERINGAAILPTDPRPFYAAIGVAEPQPYGSPPAAAPTGAAGAPLAELDLTPGERKLLEAVRGIEDEDESKRDYKVCAELIARGASDDEITRVLCAGFWRAKLARKDYVARTLVAARKAVSKVVGDAKAFRDKSRAIGEGPPEVDQRQPLFTVEEMLAEFVYIREGSQVAPRDDPRLAWSFADFQNLTAASIVRSGTRGRPSGVATLWLRHPQRVTVDTRTFRAGGPLFCKSPDDIKAINTWRVPPRVMPPADWRRRAQPFLDHLAFLVPVRAEREFLLDWLAHIEQRPGELPHVHVLMFTQRHGIGRNWFSSVLARVWPGVTALDVDLPALLDGKYNGRLSRKLLAVVNEVREGGANAYRHADRLRTLLTDERRRINPKYGREYDEFNAVRWLMFSNHESAVPLDRFDRRVYAIRNPDKPRGANYYKKLYALATDGLFIASVREALRCRAIKKFNPGMHAPQTETKQQVIEASMSDAELEMQDVVESYASACITSDALGRRLFGAGSSRSERAALRYIAPRAGAQKFGKRVQVRGAQHHVWVLRKHARWMDASTTAIAQEILRGEDKEAKRAAAIAKGQANNKEAKKRARKS